LKTASVEIKGIISLFPIFLSHEQNLETQDFIAYIYCIEQEKLQAWYLEKNENKFKKSQTKGSKLKTKAKLHIKQKFSRVDCLPFLRCFFLATNA